MTEQPVGEGQPYSQEEQQLFQREYDRALQAELRGVREEEIKAAAQRAAQQEIGQHRAALRGQLDEQAEETAESSSDLRDEANREAPSKLLLGLIVLLLLLFLLAVFDRLPGLGEGTANATSVAAAGRPNRLEPKLAGPTATAIAQVGRGPGASGEPGQNAVANVDMLFAAYYDAHDGYRLFGLPISPLLTYNGRQVQWFERARLEYLPDSSGTEFAIAPALLGVEYLGERRFPIDTSFQSRPGTRLFPETGHALSGQFLDYWQANGGLEIFGYPISDVVIETPPDSGQSQSVQYFERARFELHIHPDGTQEIMLGLLGRALYQPQNDAPVGAEAEPKP